MSVLISFRRRSACASTEALVGFLPITFSYPLLIREMLRFPRA
jgi:hypothetical protein